MVSFNVLGLLNWTTLDSTIAAVAASKKDQPQNATEIQKKMLSGPLSAHRPIVAVVTILISDALLYGFYGQLLVIESCREFHTKGVAPVRHYAKAQPAKRYNGDRVHGAGRLSSLELLH